MCPQHFATERNIDNFHSRLLLEDNQDVRDLLLRLLVEEENKYGNLQEQALMIQKKIARGNLLIEKQKQILNEISDRGEDPTQADRVLANFIETQRLLQSRLDIVQRQNHMNSAA